MLFSLLQEIRKNGVTFETFNEQKQLAEIDFRFREDVEAYTLVRAFAARMHEYPVDDLYFAPYRYDTFDFELILSYLSHLRPKNLHLLLLGPELETNRIETHYGVFYSIESLPENLISDWLIPQSYTQMFLPKPNPFIPFDLELRQDPTDAPKPTAFHISDSFTLWFDHDSSYRSPRGNFYLSVRSPFSRTDAKETVLTELYTAVVVDQLNEFAYPARLAGLEFQLYDHQRGFTLKISGYTDKQAVLLGELIKALRLPEITPSRFDRLRKNLVRQLKNYSLERPYAQGLNDLRRLLLDDTLWPDALIKAAEVVTSKQLDVFVPRLLSSVEAVALAHGNYTPEEALLLADVVFSEFLQGKPTVDVSHREVVQLESRDRWVRDLHIDHPDALSVVYLQGDSQSIDHRARFYLAGQILNSPFYQRLRTEQEMGYFVFCGSMDVMEVPGFVFVVQSPNQDPDTIENAIIQFLQDFDSVIWEITETEFTRHKSSLIGDVMRQEERLGDRSERYWIEIDRENYNFDYRETLAEAIGEISLEEFRHFFGSSIVDSKVPRIVIKSYGDLAQVLVSESANKITDPKTFRSSRGRFPTAN
jgi:secreted Zn-dependent insulinase-like peptidase